jgi:hypothetical protein
MDLFNAMEKALEIGNIVIKIYLLLIEVHQQIMNVL